MNASFMADNFTSSNLYQHGWPRRVSLPSIMSSVIKKLDWSYWTKSQHINRVELVGIHCIHLGFAFAFIETFLLKTFYRIHLCRYVNCRAIGFGWKHSLFDISVNSRIEIRDLTCEMSTRWWQIPFDGIEKGCVTTHFIRLAYKCVFFQSINKWKTMYI